MNGFRVICKIASVMSLMQKPWKSTPPPLTGGGWGVGDNATCDYRGTFPPTLTLPRQGGGNIFDFHKHLTALLISCLLACSALGAETIPADQADGPDAVTPHSAVSYYVEISISRNLLTLYKKTSTGDKTPVAEYPVGTVVRGLKTYPLGLGKVTGISFNPWWHPTPYSRQVFRERGIKLPPAVPPGHPLNYMGPFKISLSHKTWKGAIYRIHGNNNPKRVGRRVTGGCFVMNNEDGLALAHKIKVGTEVNIVP